MIPWLYDIFNVWGPPVDMNRDRSLGPLGLAGRPGFSPVSKSIYAHGSPFTIAAGISMTGKSEYV